MEDILCIDDAETWVLFFDGSMCSQRQGVGCVIRPPNQLENELFIQLEFECTNNQAKYEALVSGLDILIEMGVRRVEIFGDSKLVIQQIKGKSQCLDGRLNAYLEKCMDLLRDLEWYKAEHIRQEDRKANSLVQQASGYDVKRG